MPFTSSCALGGWKPEWKTFLAQGIFLPWPEVHISEEEVPHDPLQLAEPIGEWLRGVREGLDEPSLQVATGRTSGML